MTDARPLRGAALAAARNTRPAPTPSTPIAPGVEVGPLTVEQILCHPDVTCRADPREIAVAVFLPSYLATRLAALLPDPESRDALTSAAHTIALEETCAELDRRDLLTRTENPL